MHTHRLASLFGSLRRSMWLICVASLGALALMSSHVIAADMDCFKATSDSEKQICSNELLRIQDTWLAKAYAEALQVAGVDVLSVKLSQRQWLQERDLCLENADCLDKSYTGRIRQLKSLPDAVDWRAIRELKLAVEKRSASEPEFALDHALASVQLEPGNRLTAFTRGPRDEGASLWPVRRPAGVSRDEWAAVKKAPVQLESETGALEFLLIDVEGRGRRDLAVESYIGGTGLWQGTTFMRRQGGQFVCAPACDEFSANLFSVNGRGGNQSGRWVRLQGRVYLAFFDGAYGTDNVYLLRPGHENTRVARLAVRYHYQFSVPPHQPSDEQHPARADMPAERQEHLQKLLKNVDADARPVGCPVPPGANEDVANRYSFFGPAHYAFEVVSDFPVWSGNECQLGRLIDWFGSYGEGGLFAVLSIRNPGSTDDLQEELEVTARRRIRRIDINVAKRP